MDVIEAIHNRRSLGAVDPDQPVDRAVIEELITCATFAPNHKLTEPWRFLVLTGPARAGLGRAVQKALRRMGAAESKIEAAPRKPFRAPALIVISSVAGSTPVVTLENQLACAAATQNLLLAAHARGLGAIWRSGAPAYEPEVAEFCAFEPGETMIGIVYLGHPRGTRPAPAKRPLADVIRWRQLDETLDNA